MMGWGRMLLLGNWGQQMDIEDQRREIEDLRQKLKASAVEGETTLKSRVAQLENENRELKLYVASLIKYLGHKGVLLQDEFRRLVETVDMEDGTADRGYQGRVVN